jgi:glycosyltransferase involved in cell wall biosynthesis
MPESAVPNGVAAGDVDQGTAVLPRDTGDLVLPHEGPEITVLSPVYMGEQSVPELVDRVRDAVEHITKNYEIVLVEDGSPDGSWRSIETACRSDHRVKGIRFSRNFGQEYALTAGLAAARGQYVAVLDCDLQDDPKFIPDLYRAARNGFDIVYTRKQQRQHPILTNVLAHLFHFVFNALVTNAEFRSNEIVGNYTLLSRRAVDAFLAFKEYHRHYLCILRRLGFPATYVDIEHCHRPYGTSSYSIARRLAVAINIITSETDRLLRLTIGVGFALVAIALAGAVYVVIGSLVHGYLDGWASLFVLILVSTGAILTLHGIAGIFLGKILEQTKNRPWYFLRDRINFPDDAPSIEGHEADGGEEDEAGSSSAPSPGSIAVAASRKISRTSRTAPSFRQELEPRAIAALDDLELPIGNGAEEMFELAALICAVADDLLKEAVAAPP